MPKKVFDIFKKPERENGAPKNSAQSEIPVSQNHKTEDKKTSGFLQKKRFRTTLVTVLVILVGFYGIKAINLKDFILLATDDVKSQFRDATTAFKNFDLISAQNNINEAQKNIDSAYRAVDKGVLKISLKTLSETFKSLFNLGKVTASLAANTNYLAENAFDFIVNKKGAYLISSLEEMRDNLNKLSEAGLDIQAKSLAVGFNLGTNLEKADAYIFSVNQFLGAFLSWLSSSNNQNILILFQNISEMRPTGGFIGSYAVATLNEASLVNLEVRDIYDPDGQLDLKIIPPRPLQLITAGWGARDANWFFDFPLSAKKIIYFLENSKIYKEKDTKFNAVIAINTEVLSDILTVTGPLLLPEYNRIVTSENFLDAIQEEVRSGEDRESGDPKKIIRTATPILLEKLGALDNKQKQELFKIIRFHIAKKDIMVYFEDLIIQSYLEKLGATGSVARLPENFFGDYLAVVNANIAGAKTDAVINQKIKFDSIIGLGGNVNNHLTIAREHRGNNRDEWWYKTDNKNYIQFLFPRGSKINSSTGMEKVSIEPIINYESNGYVSDPDVKTFESADLVFGKSTFDGWTVTKPGKTSNVEISYESSTLLKLEGEIIPYQFIFDRQSGVKGSIEINIKTPAGYHWRETNTRLFNYSSENPDRRIILDLELIPNSY